MSQKKTKLNKIIDYYLLKDGETETEDKYTMFLDWCKKEGVVMPKLDYPARFDNGLVGLRVKDQILNRECYLAVPYKMIMSVKKLLNHKILGPIISANPECFKCCKVGGDEGQGDYLELLVLTFGLIYEMTLGKESYYYPYLRQLSNSIDEITTSSWNDHEIEMVQD